MRINQYLAKHAGISRRKADDLIKSGSVRVNGIEAELSHQVVTTDIVEFKKNQNWEKITQNSKFSEQVILLYKPPQVMTTSSDPEGRKTVFDLLPRDYRAYKTAGRLDYVSEGLIVLSNNGHLILSLTHPKFKTKKKYLVGFTKPLSARDINSALSGRIIIDGYNLNPVIITKAKIDNYAYLSLNPHNYWYIFELSEGRNRQIRNMALYFGNTITRLIRVEHGKFQLTEQIFKKGYILTRLLEQ